MLHLYTFIMEFAGGTYIYQTTGIEINRVMINWIKQLDLKEIGVTKTTIDDILLEINSLEISPIPIEDVVNVWRIAFEMDNNYAEIHIIKTDH